LAAGLPGVEPSGNGPAKEGGGLGLLEANDRSDDDEQPLSTSPSSKSPHAHHFKHDGLQNNFM
jgi:hypothetical protein